MKGLVDAAGKCKDGLTDSATYPAELDKWLAEQVVIWLSRRPAGWEESSLGVTCPQKASVPPTRKKFVLGMPWTSETVYISRCSKAHGLAASVWGKPWKVSAVGRDAAIASYQEYLAKSGDLQGRLRGLSVKTLVCHCDDLDRCHGDTIIEAFEMAVAKQNTFVNDSSVVDLDSGNEGPPHKLWDGPVGKGPPLIVRRKGEWRDIVDGGGLCSPGKWPISQRRFSDSEAVLSLRSALMDSVEKFEQDVATRGLDGR